MIRLVENNITNNDIDHLISWLSTYPKLTKGVITEQLEQEWAKFIGTNYAVFVNSGSSANLLMLYSLLDDELLRPGDKIIIPTLSWATDLAPVIQLGLEPILCDCNLDDLSVNFEHLKHLLNHYKDIKVLLLVSVLGLVPNMTAIQDACGYYNVMLLEDVCEAVGSKYRHKNLGNFGTMSSFSTYFGHHLSTIEGGFICTDDRHFYNILKSLRSHGWDRDVDYDEQYVLRELWDINEFNALYTFYRPGFNFRPTDLQAVIGLEQLKRADSVISKRNNNFNLYKKLLSDSLWKPNTQDGYVSNFAYPIIWQDREKLVKALQDNNVEIRPILAGSMGTQPMYKNLYNEKILPNAKVVDTQGLYVPNNPDLTEEQIKFICDIVNDTCRIK